MKKTIEEQINDFFELWDCERLISLLGEIQPLLKLYDIDISDDEPEDDRTVRLIRTVHCLSRIAEIHSGIFATTRIRFPNLYKKLEIQADKIEVETQNHDKINSSIFIDDHRYEYQRNK